MTVNRMIIGPIRARALAVPQLLAASENRMQQLARYDAAQPILAPNQTAYGLPRQRRDLAIFSRFKKLQQTDVCGIAPFLLIFLSGN
jgi:hypothetical protein